MSREVVMKYKLETIPVWDALSEHPEGCLFCHLAQGAENRAYDTYLGTSVMNPETRVKVNSTGFCFTHYTRLTGERKPQALALISHTHLQETIRQLRPTLEAFKQVGSAKRQINAVQKKLQQRDDGCLICESIQESLRRYQYTFVHLYTREPSFKKAFDDSKGLCLHHFGSLLGMAPELLKRTELRGFCQDMSEIMTARLEQSERELHQMTQMFKSEHADKSWNGSQQAHNRAIAREIGTIRTFRKS
jgi:hypothetical protein